jgi:Na+-transporting NADH:ubiquinone oxidoreductase subunit C
MFSNRYIFIYATILVVVIAALLSTTAKILQPLQERNTRIAKIQDILASAGIESTRGNAEQLFDKHIVDQRLINRHGKVVNDGRQAFDIDLRDEQRRLQDVEAGRSNIEPVFPLFVSENNGQRLYIVPVLGRGLWGPLWGYVALKDDFNTIAGVVFDHQGETPGLGAEISEYWFQDRFIGKKIFDNDGKFVSVSVVKGGVANSYIPKEHGVDALSGSTITSDGLSDMIKQSLANYVQYFKNYRQEILRAEAEKIEAIRLAEEQRIQDSIELEQAQQRERYRRWQQQQELLRQQEQNIETQ